MLGYMPPHWKNSPTTQSIVNASGSEFDLLYTAHNDIKAQFSVDTATWGLEIFEKELGIKTDLSKPVEDRRSVIKSKMRGTGKVSAALIKLVVDAYTNGQADVTFSSGVITIEFTSIIGIPPNITDVQKAVEDIIPAHLPYEIQYKFNTYQVLSAYTHGHLATYTHSDLREGVIS
jgi:hypothetical protein